MKATWAEPPLPKDWPTDTFHYDKLILFLRRIYEKGSFVAWFDHRRCINNDDKTHDAKLAVITLVRSRGHIIRATRSHDLPEATLADQGAPADFPKYWREGPTELSRFDWIQLVGLTHRVCYHRGGRLWKLSLCYFQYEHTYLRTCISWLFYVRDTPSTSMYPFSNSEMSTVWVI